MNVMPPLKFRLDGTFKIVQFTDIHWMNGGPEDQRSLALMNEVLDAERPDLVAYTGDVIYAGDCPPDVTPCLDPVRAVREAVSAAIDRRLPWALAFGNHDTELYVSRPELTEAIAAMPYTLFERGPEDIGGYGNYAIEIAKREGGETAAVLYWMDSGAYSPLPGVQGYDWIRKGQIDWYARRSEALAARNGGKPLPALAFFHIPLPEYREVWERQTCYGHRHENVCAPLLNSGLFAAMVERGDVAGTFVGHDHVNDYWGELHGIRLSYGRATGYNTYGREGFPRGARVIQLTEGERGFRTWLRLEGGTTLLDRDQPEHLPELPSDA